MVTLLSLAKQCAPRIGIPQPSSVVGNVDTNVMLLQMMIEQTAQDLTNEFEWPELQREWLFTLVANQPQYVVPDDFDRFQSQTFWNRTQRWPLIGPLDAVSWQAYQSGLLSTTPRQRFRIRVYGNYAAIYLNGTPGTSENGQTCVFEYITRRSLRPRTWEPSAAWGSAQYCSYLGNFYDRGSTAPATTGTTPPTHTSGTVSDGSINWTFAQIPYDTFTHDTDEISLNPQMLRDGAVWRFKSKRNFDFAADKEAAVDQIELMKSKLTPMGPLSVLPSSNFTPPMIDITWYPESNFGL